MVVLCSSHYSQLRGLGEEKENRPQDLGTHFKMVAGGGLGKQKLLESRYLISHLSSPSALPGAWHFLGVNEVPVQLAWTLSWLG